MLLPEVLLDRLLLGDSATGTAPPVRDWSDELSFGISRAEVHRAEIGSETMIHRLVEVIDPLRAARLLALLPT